MMDEDADDGTGQPMHVSDRSFAAPFLQEDEGVDVSSGSPPKDEPDAYAPDMLGGAVRTLDGELAGDEFAQDAINYQILLGKIDRLLERLKLDA
jgi:ankyrin repeat and BTB/POZ domain-containing protein 1